MDKDSISICFVAAALARLSPDARRRALDTAGIAPQWLDEPRARVPAHAFSRLWLAVAQEIDDEFFGLDRRRLKVGSFALLCHAALAGETMEHAVRQTLHGLGVLLDDVAASLRVDGADAVISIDNRMADADARRFADETLLVMLHGLICWLAGRRIALRMVEFAHPCPAHGAEYTTMFSEHLRFDRAATALHFDARVLAASPVQSTATLKVFLRNSPQAVFLKYRNETGWAARVRRRLRRCVGQPSWPALGALAREFQMAATTLRRRLEAEGTSVQAIKEQIRRDAAMHYLAHTRHGIAEIGSLLGFQEPSAFHRAFKRWQGMPPGEYRAGAVGFGRACRRHPQRNAATARAMRLQPSSRFSIEVAIDSRK